MNWLCHFMVLLNEKQNKTQKLWLSKKCRSLSNTRCFNSVQRMRSLTSLEGALPLTKGDVFFSEIFEKEERRRVRRIKERRGGEGLGREMEGAH